MHIRLGLQKKQRKKVCNVVWKGTLSFEHACCLKSVRGVFAAKLFKLLSKKKKNNQKKKNGGFSDTQKLVNFLGTSEALQSDR